MDINKKVIVFLILSFLVNGCEEVFDAPVLNDCEVVQLEPTISFKNLKEFYIYGGKNTFDTDEIIEGYVISSDKEGNFYKSIYLQDKPENPTQGIKISVNHTSTYTEYPLGRKLFIKLKGLKVDYQYGSFQVGKPGATLQGITAFELDDFIINSCQTETIIPKKITPQMVGDETIHQLIQIENSQLKELELGDSYTKGTTESIEHNFDSFDESCNYRGDFKIRTSGYANFKNASIPEEKGNFIGVVDNYYDDYYLTIRGLEDFTPKNERCKIDLTPTLSLEEVVALYQNEAVEFGTDTPYITEGYIISSDAHKNFTNTLVIQNKKENPTAGIRILIDNEELSKDFSIGEKVYIKLNKLYMKLINGALTLGYYSNKNLEEISIDDMGGIIFPSGIIETLVPYEVSVSDFSTVASNTLIKVNDVQLVEEERGKAFTYFSGTEDAFRTLETCNKPQKLQIFTQGSAMFSHKEFPKGKGAITGVISDYLEIRSEDDVNFSQPYEACQEIIPMLMITEVADPSNDVNSRFVELYNAGTFEIDVTHWELRKYINGSTNYSSSPVKLSGTVLPKSFLVIAGSTFNTVFGTPASITTSYISGNGDDVYELVDASGKRIDIYGKMGEDGTSTDWEYLDGKAVRKNEIVAPNPNFTPTEWISYTKATNSQVDVQKTPQNAPENFNPFKRE